MLQLGVAAFCLACSGSDSPAPACSDPGPPAGEVEHGTLTADDCKTITVPSFEVVQAGLFTHCVHCHSAANVGEARNGAPDDVNFDTYASAKAAVLLAFPMVKQRYMPPDGQCVTNAERNRFYEWAVCGTPP